jgi:tetratricopeptide (TPR) repeat protein
MRRFALFTVPAVLVFAISAHSQQKQSVVSSPINTPASPSQSPPTPAPAMSAERTLELRADILMARKEFAAAIDIYQGILKDNPKNASILNKTGVAYQQLGGLDAAANYYKKAEKADKKMSNPVNNLGTLEYGLHHYSKAVGYYKRALTLGASQATVYSNLGYAYFSEKKLDQARECFDKALAIDPTIFENHSGSGGTVMQQRTAPDQGMLNFFLAKSYAKVGDVERTAHFLKLARDYQYKELQSAYKDKDFALVIKDQRVKDVLENRPSYTDTSSQDQKPAVN